MLESIKQLFIAFLISLILCPPSMVHAGGITPDAAAPAANQATMDTAPNGVDVVNIAAPGANGMSHNMFTDFNVGSSGVIINNGVAPGVSQLGGAMAPNPNFSGAAATTILNEVTGTGRSSIQGHTEIFGQSANYILSNPNGISINGGGFINTPKATMTTGVPQFSGNTFVGLDVRSGDILVHGAGINTNNIDAFELVTRVATINADIHAKSLSVITGQNRHNPVSGTTTTLASDGTPAPTISIDSSALGGMYAGRIKLVGTEAGVGVNTKGLVQSTQHLEMTADGKIQITNKVSSGNTLALTSQDSIDVSGTVKATGTATLTAPTVTVARVDPTDAALVSASNIEVNAGTLDNQRLMAADTEALITANNAINTGTIYSGGTSTFRIGDTLYNNEGTILAKGDAVFEGTTAGSRMATLQNDSGTIESLEGGLIFRATTFNNNNSKFTLVRGSTELSYREGGVWFYGDEGDEAWDHFRAQMGHAPRQGLPNNTRNIEPAEVSAIGLDTSRNIFTYEEVVEAIAATEAKLAADPGALTSAEKTQLNRIKSRLSYNPPYFGKWRPGGSGFLWTEIVTEDSATGQDQGSVIAAHNDIVIESGTAKNTVSAITSTTGDINITADSFENVGMDIYKRKAVRWILGRYANHNTPRIAHIAGGTEEFLTTIDHAYGTLDAGNKVNITGGTVTNGLTERNGIINAPDPDEQQRKASTVTDETNLLPSNGMFNLNTNPAQNYVIETDPALTDLDGFYGSDYMMSRFGMDPNDEANKRIGDAFYETQLVRKQIQALSAKRFLGDARTTDTEEFKRLMDNAVDVKGDLNLTPGIALTQEQIASLTKDIVWLEKRTVNGQEALVPVVYLGTASLSKIANGGAVITGAEVAINTTGDTSNAGLIEAKNQVTITADNFYNSGTVKGQTIDATATDSIRATGGTFDGGDITLKAGKDVVIAAATTTSSSDGTTIEHVTQKGSIKATGDLSIEAGQDIGILGSDVEVDGAATLKADRNVAISTVETTTTSKQSGSGFNVDFTAKNNMGSKIKTGGDLTVDAGESAAIHGSEVESGGDATIKAKGDVAVTAATDELDFYLHSEGKKGGFFGGKSSTTIDALEQRNVASVIKSNGSINIEAGADGGEGSVIVKGSQGKATDDIAVQASKDIQAQVNQILNQFKFEEKSSGIMGATSMDMTQKDTTTNNRPVFEAGGGLKLQAKNDVVLESASLKSGDTTEIIAEEGKVAMLVTKDKSYEHEVKTDMGFLTWSSKDKGKIDEKVLHTLIEPGASLTITTPEGVTVEFKESSGDVRKDVELLANAEGLEWMADLLERDDVDWQAVQEFHDEWSKSDGGLGAGGMLIVSLIASAVTAGGASTLAAACMQMTMSAIEASAGATLLHTALTAAFTSIGSQAITALGNAAAGGDLGKGLASIASEDGLKAITTAMLTANLTQAALKDLDSLVDVGEKASALDKFYAGLANDLQGNLIKAGINTGVGTAVNGGNLGENLVANIRGAAVSTLGAKGANLIGTSYRNGDLNLASRYIAHAALGGAIDLATGGDGTSGAVGAVAGEIVADTFVATYVNNKLSNPDNFSTAEDFQKEVVELQARGVDLARLGAGLAAAAVGGDVNVGAQTGANAAENNAVFCLAIAVTLTTLEFADKVITGYDAWRLVKALNDDDTEKAAEISLEISAGLATDLIPGNKIALMLAKSLDGLGLVALGTKIVGKVGGNFANAAFKVADKMPSSFGHSANDLFRNAVTPNKHGISPLSRAIDKHSSRSGSVYNSVSGSPNVKNAKAQELLEEIMNNPKTVVVEKTSNRFGNHIDMIAPDGKGLRFGKNGNFIGVLEP
ncbi:DUF637 domain-containing protein [Pseudodesulfovibrio sp. zrk46]|uniref:two-partner secretion domain-containing protein n=1 Tax=Pseudodesulfovibrio sp. zrk46 TaxID=2725288 RepID=UPI0014494994|nr:DUF637 domain-containing protein [Pseudodesulfovibrio sp. zrk46]QJB56875.1 filamentous hemagglutinin N-terminal domain-containing protein [Pseudodesulfovibrio sp. zrk46]